MRKIVFLDFDGVMHPSICTDAELFSRRAQLEIAFGKPQNKDWRIVISSDWRHGWSLDRIKTDLMGPLATCVIGATGPEMTNRSGKRNRMRQAEIEAWIAENAPDAVFAALDDNGSLFRHDCKWLVHVNGNTGLTCRNIRFLEKKLHPA